jgi:hypothetical protein
LAVGSPFLYDDFYGYSAYPYQTCYEDRYVRTPRGWRLVTVNLCDY